MKNFFSRAGVAMTLCLLFISTLPAQVKIPRVSSGATVSQAIGVTEVTIKYSRPGVKGRTIWGGLVPFDSVWRTGANEATTIAFTDSVKVGGSWLPAGTYSIATIPARGAWTVILNKKTDLWGAFGYNKQDDAVRISVTPQQGEHQEWMQFSFENLSENSADIVLQWEKVRIPFKIEVPTHELVMASAKRAIGWQQPANAANYLLGKNTDLELATKWIEMSKSVEENYWNLRIDAQILAATGKKKEAIATMERAIAMGKKMEDAPFDLAMMETKLAEWKK